MRPPLRSAADRRPWWKGLPPALWMPSLPTTRPIRAARRCQEFEKCPFGIIGLETALAVALETLVHSGRVPLLRLIELFTTGPARVLD